MIKAIVKHSAGLDVHKKVVVATIIMEQDDGSLIEQTREFGTFDKDRKELAQWLKEHNIELIVMESTGSYWKSIYATLEDKGLNVYVVNARHVKQVPGRKTDVKDSQWLATLARLGLLKNSFIPPKDFRELRLITRYRVKLKNILAGEKNRLHKLLDDGGLYLGNVVSDINGVSAKEIIQNIIVGKPIAESLKCVRGRLKQKVKNLKESLQCQLSVRHLELLKRIHEHIAYLVGKAQELDDYIFTAMVPYKKQWQILQTIPGIDALSAAVIIVELGVDMHRFGNIHQLCSWAGMCPGNNESAGKRKSGRTRKGSAQLRQILCEISNAAIKTNSQFKSKYKGLVIRRGYKRAIIAIGHKILRTIYVMLSKNIPYQDPDINYEELMVRKNAPRWIKALQEFGYVSKVSAKP